MKREIKFRAWFLDKFWYIASNADLNFWAHDPYSGPVEPIGELTPWEQFTGIYDGKGQPIYDGDIVRRNYKEAVGKDYYNMQVFWEGYRWRLRGDTFTDDLFDSPGLYLIIGNIHENPDLL